MFIGIDRLRPEKNYMEYKRILYMTRIKYLLFSFVRFYLMKGKFTCEGAATKELESKV